MPGSDRPSSRETVLSPYPDSRSRTKHRNAVVVSAIIASTLLLGAQLLIPPVVGLANNGDFEKVMEYAGLRYGGQTYEEKYFHNVITKFEFARPVRSGTGYLTSEVPLALLARVAAQSFGRGGRFDLRYLGGLHATILVLAIALFAWAAQDLRFPVPWIVAALLVFFFTDVGYAAPLNSFYSQAASLLFLLLTSALTAVSVRRDRLDGPLLICWFASAALFICSKPQESLQSFFLAILALRLAGVEFRGAWQRSATWLAVGLVTFATAYYSAIPRRSVAEIGLFHTTFMELLPHSTDPARDMDDLGLDRDLLRYSGTSAYQPGAPLAVPEFREQFFAKVGFRKILSFYLSHPGRLFDRARRGASQAFLLRTPGVGNYEAPAAPGTMARHFASWSAARALLDRAGLFWVFVLLFGNFVAATATWRRSRGQARLFREAIIALCSMAVVEFFVCLLADYLGDLARHLYVFQAMCDLLIIADVGWAAQAWRPELA